MKGKQAPKGAYYFCEAKRFIRKGVDQMATQKIKINRAPVLTLWAAVVAERLGYGKETALTLGKAVAGLNAQSKGRRLGIYEEKSDEDKKEEK